LRIDVCTGLAAVLLVSAHASAEPAATGDPAAGQALAAALAKDPEAARLMVQLAMLGPSGRAAEPLLLHLLEHDDLEVRRAAARTLGYVGDSRAAGPLIAALGNVVDWQFAQIAAESLGRIKEPSAVPALETVARAHWYPPVREAARKALEVIHGRAAYAAISQQKDSSFRFAFEFYAYQDVDRRFRDCFHDDDRRFLPDDDLARARRVVGTYEANFISYTRGPSGADIRHDELRRQKPNAALAVDDGWLLGGDRGPYGGELVFVNAKGIKTTLLDTHIQALTRLGSRLVALGGASRDSLQNRSAVYEVVQDKAGHWAAHAWRVLPGVPTGSSLQRDGRWLIRTIGGRVLLAADGTLSMASTGCGPEN
jgi:hypothetical protein